MQRDSDSDMGSDASSDLPLDMDGEMLADFDSENEGDDIEGLFAPAPEFDEEDIDFSGIRIIILHDTVTVHESD